MYEQLLAEVMHAERMSELRMHLLGQQALRQAKNDRHATPVPASAPFWQRPFNALRRSSAASNFD
jgi:hypothetical protein